MTTTEEQIHYLKGLCKLYERRIKESRERDARSRRRLAKYKLEHPGVMR